MTDEKSLIDLIDYSRKYNVLYNVGVKLEDMIRLVEKTEGDSPQKKEFLQDLYAIQKIHPNFVGGSSTETMIDFDGYQDYEERLHIFKKRLAILLKPERD